MQDNNNQGNGQAFLYGNQGNLPPRPPKRDVDNRPAWMTRPRENDKKKEVAFEDTPTDVHRKKINRLWAYSANIFISDTTNSTPPMPLDVDNGLPGIELWFGTCQKDELCFICHMDTCAAMNTGNLTVHKWLMTKYPHLVAEYIQFDDSRPFEPLKLHCAVEDLVATETLHGKLTSIVRYWIRYSKNGKKEILSFGLGDSVAVNSLVGIPTIKRWQCLLDFEDNSMIARGLNTKFPFIFEATKHGLPPGVVFSPSDFVRPLQGSMQSVTALLTNLGTSATPAKDAIVIDDKKGSIVTQTTYDGNIRRDIDVSHID